MQYEVKAAVGGKLAQLGGRLIDGTSKRLAGQFFEAFEGIVGAPAAPPAEIAIPESRRGISPLVWIIGGGLVLAAVIYFASLF